VDKAITYMHAEYMNSISIQEIADHLNLDRKYFSRTFSMHTGSSPQQYLLNLRLTKAAEFMVTHNETPSSSAALVGYTDLYQFSKIFKKHFGMSPRTYIKHYKEKQEKTLGTTSE
jgi:AraC-like DNA-binding protein